MGVRIAAIQMKTGPDFGKALSRVKTYFREDKVQEADLVVLPEMWCCPYETGQFPVHAIEEGSDSFEAVRALARESGKYLLAGSMPERSLEDGTERIYNTSFLFAPTGETAAKHRKVHLFDIDVRGGQHFRESDTLSAGDACTVADTPFGKIGIAVCYDIRFPELFRLMAGQGAKLIVVPGAFNPTTGPAHWELLIRARAVDNQVFVLGCAPAEDLDASYRSYGHTVLVNPWGRVVESLGTGEGILAATAELSEVEEIREQIPVWKKRRTDLYSLEWRKED